MLDRIIDVMLMLAMSAYLLFMTIVFFGLSWMGFWIIMDMVTR